MKANGNIITGYTVEITKEKDLPVVFLTNVESPQLLDKLTTPMLTFSKYMPAEGFD